MRLIDIERLVKEYITSNKDLTKVTYYDIRKYEVKAIPVDWIEKQKVDFENEDHPFNYCRGFQDGFNDCIDYLLSEWAEENEDIRG